MDQLVELFSGTGFMPHGHCYLWTPTLLWLFVVSDLVITCAYYSIPIALIYFVKKRQDLEFNWIFILFSAFIFACGTTHLIAVWTIWQPVYWLDATIKLITASISIITAILLWPLIPRALKLPSPTQLQLAIVSLESEMLERQQAEARLEQLNRTLEQRVLERTKELQESNDALYKEIETRKQVELTIELALKEKDLLLGEIHHRVKNNLQIINSLLSLQCNTIKNPEMLEILNDCQRRVYSMALIHQTLYQSNNFIAIDFATVLRRLTEHLQSSYGCLEKNIELELNLSSFDVAIDVATPCGLIANELISNALKHAFPGDLKGTITISLDKLNDSFELTVSDDGIGIPEEKILATSDSLGMTLITLLTDQIGGKLEIRRSNPTSFIVQVPFPKDK